MLSAHGVVAVVELAVYAPAGVASIFVCLRQGFGKSAGFYYTLVLCIVRIIGAICRLVSIDHPSEGLLTTTIVLDSIGLGPLLLATLGLLSRFVDFINARQQSGLTMKHFRFVQLLIAIGLILSIVGGTSGYKIQPDGTVSIATESKVGVIIFIPVFIAIVAILLFTLPKVSVVPPKERRVPATVALALPFIAVRQIYSVLAIFLHNNTFSVLSGKVVVWVLMAVTEEFVVLIMYLVLGFMLDKLAPEEIGPIVTGKQKKSKGRHATRSPGRRGSYEHVRDGYLGSERGYPMEGRQTTGVV